MAWTTTFKQDTEAPGVGTVTAVYLSEPAPDAIPGTAVSDAIISFTARVDTNTKTFRDDFIALAKEALLDYAQKKDSQVLVETLLNNALNG